MALEPTRLWIHELSCAPTRARGRRGFSQTQSFERFEDFSVETQLASRKRKISMETESAGSVDEMSDAAGHLVQGEECRLEVEETREWSAAEEGKGLDLLQVAPWRPVDHTSRPRQRRSESRTGPKTCARSAEWSSSWCAGKGSST